MNEPAALTASARHLAALRERHFYWSRTSFRARRHILRRFNRLLVGKALTMASMLPPRSFADSVTAEIMPLLSASRFLIQQAHRLLAPKTMSRMTRPVWLLGVASRVERRPLGCILILAPGNYPLMLAGIQTLQAIMAGNVVALKPPPGQRAALALFVDLLELAGLPVGVVTLLDEDDGPTAIQEGYDLIILTGSERSGRAVAEAAAKTLTPTIMELSGADPVFILPGADLDRVARALLFGMTLNGGETCIAPRRIFVERTQEAALIQALENRFGAPILPSETQSQALTALLDSANAAGGQSMHFRQGVILRLEPEQAALADRDCFAPWCALIPVADMTEALRLDHASAFGLGASIFGPEREARILSDQLHASSIVINDLIAPTADPRLSFGGSRRSGYGVTRGYDGLLALTRPVNICTRHYVALHLLPSALRKR